MGDSVSRPTDSFQPFGRDASVSQEGQFADGDIRKGAPEISSQQSTSQTGYVQGQQYPSHYQPVHARPESFNLSQLTTALPDVSYQNYGHLQQRYPSTSPSGLAYQTQNSPQYAAPHGMSPTNAPYPFQAQYYVASNQPPQPGMGNQLYHQDFQAQQHGSPYFIQPNQYLHSPTYPGVQQQAQYASRGGIREDNRHLLQQRASGGQGRSGSIATTSSQPSVVRGPPRKPRQTGHAIWIGNLPPQTELMNLVHHVCKEAPGLDSLFLISKSNCAFANYKDEATCAAALSKIHDSRFQNVGLVSRLRRGSVGGSAGAAAPTGPTSLTPPSPALDGASSPESGPKPKDAAVEVNEQDGEDSSLPKEKFFVLKSLTVEDLELSVRNGIWATQSHNEESLNKAYETTDKVYLIFSVNKSGEYFGYARMTSPINEDPAAAIEFAPKAHTAEDTEGPRGIPTPATELAPKGRIVDDSARGTIFWEVERDGEEEEDESSSNKSDQDETPPQAWGKPFKVEWLSTTRLPFYRTRGLRNPWNSNREVKIARDGTELETAVGRKLIRLFHRTPSPVAPPVAQMHGMPMLMVGYPHMRPFQ